MESRQNLSHNCESCKPCEQLSSCNFKSSWWYTEAVFNERLDKTAPHIVVSSSLFIFKLVSWYKQPYWSFQSSSSLQSVPERVQALRARLTELRVGLPWNHSLPDFCQPPLYMYIIQLQSITYIYMYDMIWSDLIWYDMIWYDMIWHICNLEKLGCTGIVCPRP